MFYRKKKPVYATKQPNAKQVELSGLHNCGVALTWPKAPDTPLVSVEAGFFNQLQYIENTKRDLPKKKLVYSTKPGSRGMENKLSYSSATSSGARSSGARSSGSRARDWSRGSTLGSVRVIKVASMDMPITYRTDTGHHWCLQFESVCNFHV